MAVIDQGMKRDIMRETKRHNDILVMFQQSHQSIRLINLVIIGQPEIIGIGLEKFASQCILIDGDITTELLRQNKMGRLLYGMKPAPEFGVSRQLATRNGDEDFCQTSLTLAPGHSVGTGRCTYRVA